MLYSVTFGGQGCPPVLHFSKKLASLLANRKDLTYCTVMSYMHGSDVVLVQFSLLHCATDCSQRARSSSGCPTNFDLALSEGHLSLHY